MLFENATIITMNEQRHIITHGAIVVEGSQIAAIGKAKDLVEQFQHKKRINCNGNVILPGLIDTHVHTAQAMIRGCADDLGLLDWLFKRVWVLQGSYTHADGKASAALCALEMIKSGTTGFIECMLAEVYGFDGVAETIIQSGMRAAIGKIVMDLPSYAQSENVMHPGMAEDGETSVRNTLAAYDKWEGAADGRIQVWFGARTPGGVTPELFKQIGQLAAERNMGITVHLSEVREDLDYAISVGFRSPIDFANAHGMLGQRSVLAHCVWTDAEDARLMAETGSSLTVLTKNPCGSAA